MRSEVEVIYAQNQAEIKRIQASTAATYQPQNIFEEGLVYIMARAEWSLRHIAYFEARCQTEALSTLDSISLSGKVTDIQLGIRRSWNTARKELEQIRQARNERGRAQKKTAWSDGDDIQCRYLT